MNVADFRLVLAPGLRYGDVARELNNWDAGSTDHHARLGGEPISARWTRGPDEVRYSANPAIGLRVLEGSGLERTVLASMTAAQALRMAGSAVEEEALLGATALDLLTTGQPGVDAVRAGADRIAARRTEHPDRDPVFGLLGDAATRRQVLRGFLAEPPDGRSRRLDVVRAALADDDWEVRWTAVVAAHDLGLPETALDVRRCPVGRAPDHDQREVLEVLRDVVGHRLTGGRSTTSGAAEIAAILDGDDTDPGPPLLLITALRRTTPDEPEADVPAGFVWVPVELHWLGGNGTPVRRVTPGAPYAIAAAPVPDVPAEQVQQRLAKLTAEMGHTCRLPTADELEMAVRGPDGRRFPWGNARESGWRLARSPWGLAEPLLEAEWVASETSAALPASRQGCGAAPERMPSASLRPVLGD